MKNYTVLKTGKVFQQIKLIKQNISYIKRFQNNES